MLRFFLRYATAAGLALSLVAACGARTDLSVTGDAPKTDSGLPLACPTDGAVQACGSTVGACQAGSSTCESGTFGPCIGAIGPSAESCNGIDDDCDGVIDNGFHLGQACDGPDTDLCKDDLTICGGCSTGANNVEVCNGIDDNCNGVIDADCEVGNCSPKLLVTGSRPSSDGCADFPVQKGSTGVITFACGGGAVSAKIGSVQFTGKAENGVVSIDGTEIITDTPDGCIWETAHFIGGTLANGWLIYQYTERVIDMNGHAFCWQPCTEEGSVKITW